MNHPFENRTELIDGDTQSRPDQSWTVSPRTRTDHLRAGTAAHRMLGQDRPLLQVGCALLTICACRDLSNVTRSREGEVRLASEAFKPCGSYAVISKQ